MATEKELRIAIKATILACSLRCDKGSLDISEMDMERDTRDTMSLAIEGIGEGLMQQAESITEQVLEAIEDAHDMHAALEAIKESA
jgi:hypothetical protein